MLFQVPPKKRARADPWERDAKEESYSPDEINYIRNYSRRHPKFYSFPENLYLDIYTKRAALKASPAVVSLVSYSDEEEIFHSSGTVIEGDDTSGIVLTSASLIRCPTNKNAVVDNVKVVAFLSDGKSYEGQILAYDLYYNIAALRIQSNAPLPIASLTHLDDSITVDPNELCSREEKAFQLRPHSSSFNLIPGDKVIAIGRYFIKPFDLMAAPGEFSLDRCQDEEYDCKELFRANCIITRCGTGGPLINRFGEVIGIITFYDTLFTPFIPINVACKWWEHYKKNGETRRLWLGMEVTNFYAAELHIIEKITQKFPNVFKGLIVEEVMPGSSADSAGICPNDVIVQCGGKTVRSFLEFFEVMWDKGMDPVELIVIRESADDPLHVTMVDVAPTPDVPSPT